MSSPSILGRLHHLDESSSGFHDQLNDILYGEEYKQWVHALGNEDLISLVDYLDKALDSLDPASPGFYTCLRELRHICGTGMILPTSYTLSSVPLVVDRQPVASGGSGDLYEGTFNGSRACVKRGRVYSKDGPGKAIKTLYQEAVVWKRLHHQHIVPLLGVTSPPLQLISEWMPGGDLTEYIKKHPDTDGLNLLCDVAEGLRFLHSRNIVHGDLRGSNVLVDGAGRARITDFSQATVVQNPDSMRVVPGDQGNTTQWTAPEILNETGTYSKASDVFSFAMIMIEVFTGAIPFNNSRPAVATLAIMSGKRPPRPTHPALTDQLWTLMQRCWDQDPHLRPQVSEALQIIITPEPPAWKRLISNPLSTNECISLITSIFSDHDEAKVVRHLSGDGAQAFIDVIYEALDNLPQKVRGRCLRSLYRICGRQALIPSQLSIPLCYDPKEMPLCRGGFADVWKGRHEGREVASKVLRIYLTNDFEQIKKRFCREVMTWKALRHPNILPLLGVTMTGMQFVMVSEWMVKGNIKEFVKADINADRLGLLIEVTRGLSYMHDQGIVHGDLKGGNILVDNDGHARLADFSLLTITSDQSTIISSCIEGGTIQWMSPELLDPESFDLNKIRPTKESDCYALGMVIYEVLSGKSPFGHSGNPVVIRKVLDGERPVRPQGEEGSSFTDSVWRVLKLCWKPWPRDRISARGVLLGLGGSPSALMPTPLNVGGDSEADTDDQSDTTTGESESSNAHPPQTADPEEGWVPGMWGRNAGKAFKATIKRFHRP